VPIAANAQPRVDTRRCHRQMRALKERGLSITGTIAASVTSAEVSVFVA
jgi:hypothetical protein